MEEPWQLFFEQFQIRVDEITSLDIARDEELAELAHDAYEATTDLLIEEQGYEEDEALALSKAYAEGVRMWLDSSEAEDRSWDELEERLATQQQEWELGDVPV